MKKYLAVILFALMPLLNSCSENYSEGERIGVITQFSKTGLYWKSWEGHLNTTQTGMNSSVPFDFSLDNNWENPKMISTLDSAAKFGWKIKLIYHEVAGPGKNLLHNRGETNHFINKVEVLDKDFSNRLTNGNRQGRVVDTIYVVIDKTRN